MQDIVKELLEEAKPAGDSKTFWLSQDIIDKIEETKKAAKAKGVKVSDGVLARKAFRMYFGMEPEPEGVYRQ